MCAKGWRRCRNFLVAPGKRRLRLAVTPTFARSILIPRQRHRPDVRRRRGRHGNRPGAPEAGRTLAGKRLAGAPGAQRRLRPQRRQPTPPLPVLAHRHHGPLGMRGVCGLATQESGLDLSFGCSRSDYNDCIAITSGPQMSSITVRNLDEAVKNSLRIRAARHGWSMEQEVRQILQQTVALEPTQTISFAERINKRFAGLDAESLALPARQPARMPPGFDTP